MTAAVPTSVLTSDQLLKLANFRRDLADDLDAALTAAATAGLTIVSYTATGAEAPGGFTVPIGQTISGAYNVTFWGVETDIIVPWAWSFPTASKTSTSFVARFAGDAISASGVYYFVITATEA